MDRNLALEIIRVSEASALSSSRWMGKGEPGKADMAAVKAMRVVFNSIDFNGEIVLGYGTSSSAEEFSPLEKVGCGETPEVDIAIDPLECTSSVAFGRPNAMAVIAMAPRGDLMKMPQIYMDKLAVGEAAAEVIDLNAPIEENLANVASAKNYKINDLTVAILERKRHQELIARVRKAGARIHLIPDGDTSAAVAAALPGTGIDMLVGSGGAPEGVLAAAALNCIGGKMLTRLVPRGAVQENLAREMGIEDFDRIRDNTELARGDQVMFAATGVTDGDLLNGVRYRPDGATTHSLVLRSATLTRRFIVTEHYFDGEPKY